MKSHSLLCILIWVSALTMGNAQTIPAARITNWQKAGLSDTLPEYGNVVNIISHGAVADGVTSNNTAFNNAVLALNGQPGTIYIPAGNYLFTQAINITVDSIIIRGDGIATRLLFDLNGNNENMFNIKGAANQSGFDVAQAVQRNDTSLTAINVTGISTTNYVLLTNNDSNIIFSPWALRSAGQILKVKSVNGNTLAFDNNIRRHYPAASTTIIKQIHPVRGVGIECLYMERKDATAQQTNNIDFTYAANCWVTGIESNMTNFCHVAVNYSTHILIRGNYFHHAHGYGGGGEAYGTTLEYTSGDCLVENNIFEHLRHSMLVQAGANGNVFAYNYSTDPYWTQPPLPTNSAGDIVCHGNYPYLNLFEGNIVQNIVVDESHGINGPYNTFYRNRAEQYGIFTVAAASDSQNYAVNEITNATGYYLLTGLGFFEAGNNVKGTIMPATSTTPAESSLYRTAPPGYWPGQATYPSIGTPHPYTQGTLAAKQRYASSQKTDCRRNPAYVTVPRLDNIKDALHIAPNPFNSTLRIESANAGQYRMVNMAGITVLSGIVQDSQTIINTTTLTPGIYILDVTDNDGFNTRRKVMKAAW